LVLPPLVALFG